MLFYYQMDLFDKLSGAQRALIRNAKLLTGEGGQNVRIKHAVLLSALVISSIITLAIQLSSTSLVHAALTLHAPISISGNVGFTKPDPVNGGGSGTKNDPYIIENWVISASSANGIDIEDTTAYFIIRNCLIENGYGGTGYSGIFLDNVVNGRIENNICDNCLHGIDLGSNSNYIVMDNNTCFNNIGDGSCGIHLYNDS
jgi:parallel beta-helix repeat protein